jgi:O-methyltransferase
VTQLRHRLRDLNASQHVEAGPIPVSLGWAAKYGRSDIAKDIGRIRRGGQWSPLPVGLKPIETTVFPYYSDCPFEGRAFTGAMSVSSMQVADEIARVLDTSWAKLAVDVGASGTLIAALLIKNPTPAGTILDRPDVVARAKVAVAERGLSSRCHVVEGDFFVAVPEADLYLLKHIIHDRDDEQSVMILSNWHARYDRKDGSFSLSG